MPVVVNGSGSITGLSTDGLAYSTGLGADGTSGNGHIIKTNGQTVSENLTIPTGTNGVSGGPITIADTFTVTVNGYWTVV
jgi:hypothetical protein